MAVPRAGRRAQAKNRRARRGVSEVQRAGGHRPRAVDGAPRAPLRRRTLARAVAPLIAALVTLPPTPSSAAPSSAADASEATAVDASPSTSAPSSDAPTTDATTTNANAAPKVPASKPETAKGRDDVVGKTSRRLRLHRNDVVRFRKRSSVAKGLGVNTTHQFTVEAVTRQSGRPMVILTVGKGKHSALIKVPPGHLAIVRRADELPKDVRACAAKLARFDGPISPKTRRLMVELARRS